MYIYTTSTAGIFVGWETTSNLGTLIPGEKSELYVKLAVSTSTIDVKYKIIDGVLPDGLTLNHDGTISGTVKTNTASSILLTNSAISISAVDNHDNQLLTGTFNIIVSQSTSTEYTNLYFKPLQTQTKRLEYTQFIHNENIFEKNLIYRPYDTNFGIEKNLKMVLDFGSEKVDLSTYAEIISKNFQKRRFLLGTVRSAVARNSDKTVRHHIIYVDVIDKNLNLNKDSISKQFVYRGITYYPSSIVNMRSRIKENIKQTNNLNPAFTKEIQSEKSAKLGYTAFIPICFVVPGAVNKILRNIATSDFKFGNVDYDIDRIYIEESLNNEGDKYLLLSRSTGLS